MASTLPQPRAHKTIHALRVAGIINAPAPLRYWHLASFDAPTVAVVWTLAFAWVAHVAVPAWVLALDLLVVWAVYVSDRLLDARRGLRCDSNAMRDRHWFHWRHRRMLGPLALAATIAAACLAFHSMPAIMWERDSVVGVASLAYFAGVHDNRLQARVFSKEMVVGVLFTAGCALPALSWSIAAPLTLFAALAWLNCWAIDRWESAAPGPGVEKLAMNLAFICVATAVCIFPFQQRASVLLLAGAGSAFSFAALDRIRTRMTPIFLRAFADVVLLTPAIVLIVAKVA